MLQLIAEGKSTKDVASLLGISVKTAESHRTRLMHKLDIHETRELGALRRPSGYRPALISPTNTLCVQMTGNQEVIGSSVGLV